MLNVVIDTNIVISILSPISKHRAIFNSLKKDDFTLILSNEILLEYEEVISRKYGVVASSTFKKLLDVLPNVRIAEPHFKWELMTNDKDDNKFVDAALAASADYIVTEDKHFNILKKLNFPKVNVINAATFATKLPVKKP